MCNKFFCCLLLLLLTTHAYALCQADLVEKLEKVFIKTMNSPIEFENSQIFQLLGYDNNDLSAISRVTPMPESIKVEIELDTECGRFKKVRVTTNQVRYYGLNLQQAVFEFPDSVICLQSLEKGLLRFLAVEKINLQTKVSESNLLKVFEMFAAARSLYNLKISLRRNRAQIRGRLRRGLFVVQFNVQGNAVIANNRQINFDCSRIVLNNRPLPRSTVRSMFSSINPVFDSTDAWLNLKLHDVKIINGYVETTATIERKKGS